MLNIPADNVRTVIQRHRFVDVIEVRVDSDLRARAGVGLTRVALAQTASQTATKQHLKTLSFISASQQIWQARGFAGFYAGYPVKARMIFHTFREVVS